MLTTEMIHQMSNAVTFGKTRGEIRAIDDDNFIHGHLGEKIDGNIGKLFDSHGIAKESIKDQLKSLNTLLTLGPSHDRPFYTAPFAVPAAERALLGPALGTGGGTSYKHGNFVIVSKLGQKITDKNSIGYVAVNYGFYKQISLLQAAFPGVKFVKMIEMPKVLTDDYNKMIQQQRIASAHQNV
jgi:hypothetical protein